MAVVIRDMEMPKCCGECEIFDFVTYARTDGKYARCPFGLNKIKPDVLVKKRHDECPLYEIVLPEELVGVDVEELLK